MRVFLSALVALSFAATAGAQTGVNDDRVSLPEGPGSLEGVGDNAAVGGNQGAMVWSQPIEVVPAFAPTTPQLSLDYNSMGGNGVAGMGFTLALPYVERMTNRGLPSYTDDDVMVFGAEELVRVSAGEPATYRARFEKGFARYHWHGRHAADGGYWRVEQADGTVWWFGAEPDGARVPESQFQGWGGPFRWHPVEVRDRFGHRMALQYATHDAVPYLERIEYVFTDGPAKAAVSFEYAPRADPILDARSGAEERQARRLVEITAWAEDQQYRRYALTYEPYAESGGLSRLLRIEQFGIDDMQFPTRAEFSWSKALGGVCIEDCRDPILVQMGSIGANLAAGGATLVDINADALPDIVDTSQPGAHQVHLSRLDADGVHDFAPAFDSQAGTQAGHALASPYTQVLDANGDGRADVVNVRTGQVLYNRGTGDWDLAADLEDTADLPDFGEEFAVGAEELTHVRFLDYDNDRRIDVIRSSEVITQIYANLGAAGFALAEGVEDIGAGFADQRLEFADLNGDGQLDPVLLRPGQLSYRLNLGRGRWSDWRLIEDLPFNDAQIDQVELEDLNGDSLDDIVLVLADEVRYALNRGGLRFDDVAVLRETGQGALPQRVDGTTVLFADMNGSGSDDVVWITAAGDVTYLELFPLRPNLMTGIVDNYGVQTRVEYVTAAQLQARADAPWTQTPPFAMAMVERMTTHDPLTDLTEVTELTYRDGFYDPIEKQFRGFAQVERVNDGDAHVQTARVVEQFELGVDDPYRAGLQLSSATFAEDAEIPLITSRSTFEDCPLDALPDAPTMDIRFVCETVSDVIRAEGRPAAEHVTIRERYTYDAWGNRVLTEREGVIDVGGGGCAPCDPDLVGQACGPACLGDEKFTEVQYVAPALEGGGWLVGLPWRERTWATPDTPDYTETLTYYDGDAFVGLPSGRASLGVATRILERAEGDVYRPVLRGAFDRHGNLVEELSPLADLGDLRGHRMFTRFDPTGLDIVERVFEVRGEAPADDYALRRQFDWDPVSGRMVRSTDWFIDGEPGAARYTYDGLGRLTATIMPGDDPSTPTTTWTYDFSGAISTVIRRNRSVRNSALPDREQVQCFDSIGRKFQERVRVEPGRYRVLNHTVYDVRGRAAIEYMDHEAPDAACDVRPPQVRAVTNQYDALGRISRIELPDADQHGTASVSRVEYRPLGRVTWDAEDTDPQSPFAHTPTITHVNGREQIVAVEFMTDPPVRVDYGYDGVGRVVAVRDPVGNLRRQRLDGQGRLVEVDDPDRGRQVITYDAAGRITHNEDARGVVTRNRYDSLGRRIETWEESDPEGTRARFFYDKAGDCAECTHPVEAVVRAEYSAAGRPITAWYAYDDRRRMVGRRMLLDGVPFATRTTYDNLGEVVAEHFPGDLQLRYTRDASNRLLSIEGLVDGITYAGFSEVAERRFANGVTETHDFNGMRQGVRRLIANAGAPLVDLGYTYNRLGHLTQVDDALADDFDGPGLGARYTYDALYRLTEAVLDPERPAHREALEYRYSADGRLLSRRSSRGAASPLHVDAYRYAGPQPHAVSAVDDLALRYDAGGALIARGDVTYARGQWGRITEARRGDDVLARFGYTPNGRRVFRQEGHHEAWELGAGVEVHDGMLRVHAMVGAQRLATLETDAIAAQFLPDAVPDAVINSADAIRGPPEQARLILSGAVRSTLLEGQRRTIFYHYDHLMSVVALTDADGALVERRAHAPFGAARHADSGVETTYGYSSRRTDRSTGLTDFGARFYDPRLGRWAAPDPGFTEITADALSSPFELVDPYGYALNNPINAYDPDGNKSGWATAGKWAVRAGVFLGGAGLGLITGGASNLLAAGLGAAGAFTGAALQELAYYKYGNIKPTVVNVGGAVARTAFATLGGFVAGGFFGLGWAVGEAGRAVVGTGLAIKAASKYDAGGDPTTAVTKWELALSAVNSVSPAVASPVALLLTAGRAVHSFYKHKAAKRLQRNKVRKQESARGIYATRESVVVGRGKSKLLTRLKQRRLSSSRKGRVKRALSSLRKSFKSKSKKSN